MSAHPDTRSPWRDGWLCLDCDEHGPSYMVTDPVWAEAVPEYDALKALLVERQGHMYAREMAVCLCLACLARRLGRDLREDDFDDSPVNEPIRVGIRIGRNAAVAQQEPQS